MLLVFRLISHAPLFFFLQASNTLFSLFVFLFPKVGFFLIACVPVIRPLHAGSGYCNTRSQAAASRHAGDQGSRCQGNRVIH